MGPWLCAVWPLVFTKVSACRWHAHFGFSACRAFLTVLAICCRPQGPAVILAPAVAVAGWKGRLLWPTWPRQRIIPPHVASRCIVVCGAEDRTVPPSAVKGFCEINGLEFHCIPGGDHTLNNALVATQRLRTFVEAALARRPKRWAPTGQAFDTLFSSD